MNFKEIQEDVKTPKFITTYITIFIILFIFTSLMKFIGSLPMLIILTFVLTYYVGKMNMKKIEKFANFT
jgi:hypothetical protein|tara:strand:+ start:2939 stop:3145 length:207 start_codon:yes stop_codon:yes gene_type:complete